MPRIEEAMEVLGDWIVRRVVGIYAAFDRCLFSRSVIYESLAWTLYDINGHSVSEDNFNQLDIGGGDALFIAHNVVRSIGSHNVYKTAIHWIDGAWRAPYDISDLFTSPPPPWLFIGFGESADNLTDCTDELHSLIAYDNLIRVEVLHALMPASEGKTWYYINPKTFETLEFPDTGILIDDPPAPETQPEPASTKDD
jgi:hypothetical protein